MEVTLRPVREGDLGKLMEWRNLHMDYFRQYRPLTMADQRRWLDGLHDDPSRIVFSADVTAENRQPELVGCCGLYKIDWQERRADLGIMVGEPGRGYGTAMLNQLHAYAFKVLGLRRMQLEMFSFNPAWRFYTKAGYVATGRWRQAHLHKGKWRDVVLMDLLEEEWRRAQ